MPRLNRLLSSTPAIAIAAPHPAHTAFNPTISSDLPRAQRDAQSEGQRLRSLARSGQAPLRASQLQSALLVEPLLLGLASRRRASKLRPAWHRRGPTRPPVHPPSNTSLDSFVRSSEWPSCSYMSRGIRSMPRWLSIYFDLLQLRLDDSTCLFLRSYTSNGHPASSVNDDPLGPMLTVTWIGPWPLTSSSFSALDYTPASTQRV